MKSKFRISLIAASIGVMLHDALFSHMTRSGLVASLDDPEIKALPEAVQKSLDKIADQVRAVGEKAMAEAKKHGEVSSKVKEQVDELLVEHGGLVQKMKDTQQELVKLRDAQKAQPEKAKSMGELFAEAENFKAFAKGDGRGSVSIEMPRKAISSSLASAGDAVAPDFRPAILPMPTRRFTIRDLMMPGATSSNAVTYVKETGFTNNAAPVSETVKKPESTLVLDAVTQPVITLAHFMKAAKQIIDDVPQLQSFINGRLAYGLKYVEEVQLLKGSGVGQNLNGIYTQATAYVQPSGVVVTSETIIDRLRLMLLQVFLAEFPATGIVLNPIDWASIELTKESTGGYIVGKPTEVLGPRLWGLPAVDTQAMTVNTALVGAFTPMSQIFDRETINVVLATTNEDDFVKNLLTIRCEERLASAVYRPEAFVKAADITP